MIDTERLKRDLNSAGMNQKELAKRLGVSESAVSRYLAGTRNLSPDMIVEISKILMISTDELLGVKKRGIHQYELYENEKEKVLAMSVRNKKKLMIALAYDLGKNNKKEMLDIVNSFD